MTFYKTILISAAFILAFQSITVFANDFCVHTVTIESPEKLDRSTDIQLKPTFLVSPINEGTPIFYNKSTKREGYGYRVETKDYGPRQKPRLVFWSLNEEGNFFGPFDLKQDSYRSFEYSGKREKIIYDTISGSIYFETGINSEKLQTTGTGRSYTRIAEIPRGETPKIWSPVDFNFDREDIGTLDWEKDFHSPVLRHGRNILLFSGSSVKPMPINKTRESHVFHETLAVQFDGEYYGMHSNRVNSVIPKKGDALPQVAEGTIVKELRSTADKGWYVGNVGRVYHDGLGGGYFTYTTAFRIKKSSSGVVMAEKKKFKPSTIFPFRSTGKCQIYSPILKRVIFCSRGKYLKNGRQVKMKGAKPPKNMKYIGDDLETQVALFQASGQLYAFDGEILKKMPFPKFRNIYGGILNRSGRQFTFVDGNLHELNNGELEKIIGLSGIKPYGSPRTLISTGEDVLYVVPSGIYNINKKTSAVKVWEPPTGDYIDDNSHKFTPTYTPFLDSLLFATLTKNTNDKHDSFEQTSKYYRIAKCSKN